MPRAGKPRFPHPRPIPRASGITGDRTHNAHYAYGFIGNPVRRLDDFSVFLLAGIDREKAGIDFLAIFGGDFFYFFTRLGVFEGCVGKFHLVAKNHLSFNFSVGLFKRVIVNFKIGHVRRRVDHCRQR